MSFDVPERVHVAPLGLEFDRIVDPAVEYGADQVVLLDYLPDYLADRLRDEEIAATLDDHGIDCEVVACDVDDLFDAMATFGRAIADHPDDEVYVNLSTGNKVTAIAGMIACMAAGGAQPYYVEAQEHGSHQAPIPSGVRSIESVPPYPMDSPQTQHLAIMHHVDESTTTGTDGEPYRIKRELFEFGEDAGLPFIADYTGDTDKGKFRLLDSHVIDPLTEKGYLRVDEVGTQKRVKLTEDGRNTLRAFRYLIEEE